jgi:large subunit ribosomal protein L15
MTRLNELSPRPGSTKARMRIGRGPGSGKGKTGGRGVKGQKSRSGVAIHGFEGGQMPLHMRMPKRGFNNPFSRELAEVNFWRLEQAIVAGKLDAKKPIDGAALVASGVVRRLKDGVRLLGKGELKSKIDITVHSASASAKAAVEKAGGKITLTAPVKPATETAEAEKPAAKKAATEKPAAEKPAPETTEAEKPAAKKAATEKPAAEKPAAKKSAAAKAEAEKPAPQDD